MTGTGKQSAALRADFLRHELQEAAPRATGVEGYMENDAAVGVGSVIPGEAGDPVAFVNFVDTQLYRAKDNGRDCIAAGKPAG